VLTVATSARRICVPLALGTGGEVGDQFRQQGHCFIQHLLHLGAGGHAALQHAVEQVLDGPGQFRQHQGPHHAAAAFEGVEGSAHFAEGGFIDAAR